MGTVVRPPQRAVPPAQPSTAELVDPAAVVPLDRAAEAGPAAVGAKAANLGRAAAAGLPVLPGFVISTDAVVQLRRPRAAPRRLHEGLALAWALLSDNGRVRLVVRSSSPAEDQADSSMAGLFTSVVAVEGWAAFLAAIGTVAGSAGRCATGGPVPMAVLVQTHLDPRLSGVMFGLDPLTGRTDRRAVAAVEGGPQALVSGEVDGTRYLLGPRGRLVEMDGPPLPLRRRDRRALAGLARQGAATFGGPQDIEWAIAPDGVLWLLQARPVTVSSSPAGGPLFGPGPLAETFPEPLGPLEADLWVTPLRRAVSESIRLTGSASRRRLAASPVVVTVAGRVAADLGLLGSDPTPPAWWSRLDPRPSLRRLRAAWTVGRLRAALPTLAAGVTAAVDAELAAVPPLGQLGDDRLLLLLDRAGETLVAVHGHEMLAGLLPPSSLTAASLALDALAAGRAGGLDDAEIVSAWPVVLVLTPPALEGASRLPGGGTAATGSASVDLGPREALRLRARWLHELTVRAVQELGRRLVTRGLLDSPDDVGLLTRAELEAAVCTGVIPALVRERRGPVGPPLPAAFRLVGNRAVAVVPPHHQRSSAGRGASPGRATGPAYQGPLPAPPGSVLVVGALEPGLAPHLDQLAGLVAETGNALSHLAILARERGVPCVVGHAGARDRLPSGTPLLIDGSTGVVEIIRDGGR